MRKRSKVDVCFRALAEPTRRAIVERLSQGPATASALALPFDMTLAAVIQHIQVLEACGLVRSEKVGRVRTCRVEPAGFAPITDWIADRRKLAERRLDRLAELLDEEDRISTTKPGNRREKKPREKKQ
jgi:DNA-binding transcriptional ArsR family regulator